MNLSPNVKTVRLLPDGTNYTASAAATAATSNILDTAGYDGVRFLIGFGAIVSGAATSVKVQQNTANSTSGMADIAGTSITVADDADGKVAVIEILRPQERYLRVITSRATQNATVDFLVAELFDARSVPVTQDTTILGYEQHISPAEGTA